MRDGEQLPIFPVRTVLYPDAVLQLRIFEPRYLRMVSTCMKQGSGFGVCLIMSGEEIGAVATPYEVGTQASIVDWTLREDGLLGITVRGERRFRIHSTQVQADQLLVAEVSYFNEVTGVQMPRRYQAAVTRLREMMEKAGSPWLAQTACFNDADWVSYRLAELLPIGVSQQQYLLQIEEPVQRLERVCAILECADNEE